MSHSHTGKGHIREINLYPGLHVCLRCDSDLVYPVDWAEEGPRHWRVNLRCPNCEKCREGVFEQDDVEELDNELDHGSAVMHSDLRRITHANMSQEAEFFIRALKADIVTPDDFLPRKKEKRARREG